MDPPSGSMQFAGSITLPEEHFMKVAEWAVRSFKVHGFTDIVFLGDNTGSLHGLQATAEKLNTEWEGRGARVHFVNAYNDAAGSSFDQWLVAQGENREDMGHAGIKDTSDLMAIEDMLFRKGSLIRWNKLAPDAAVTDRGVRGDPSRASVTYGYRRLELKIVASVRQIRTLTKQGHEN